MDTENVKIELDKKLLDACIHCGLCLPACPTYLATGREMESPRGRIYLLDLWLKQNAAMSTRTAEHLESCLGCLGCQTACPSGVEYGKILNQVKPELASMRPKRTRRMMRLILGKILPDYRRLEKLGSLLRLWQISGASTWLSSLPWFNKYLGYLSHWQDLLPDIPKFVPLPRQSWMSGEKRGQVNLFTGCVMNIFYNHVNHACQRLLNAQRQVTLIPEQTCCGALAYHAGETDIALALGKKNIELLENLPGAIVVTAAGCGAMLKEYPQLFADSPQWRLRAENLALKIKDISEFLCEHEFAAAAQTLPDSNVAYHAACHLCHAQKIQEAPQKLLAQLSGLTLVPLTEAEHCCGSAGIFNLTHNQLSMEVLQRKLDYLEESGADQVVTTNPGCILQLQYGLKSRGSSIKVRHLAEILDEAYFPA